MPIRLSIVALLSILFTASRADAQFSRPAAVPPGEDFHLELGAMFWQPTPQLIIGTDALDALGSHEVDFVREFAVDNKRFTEFRAVVHAARKHKFRFSYIPVHYEQDAVLQRRVTFGGRTFDIGLPANADLKWDLWRFGYEWDFVSRSRGLVGLITELKYNKVSANITSPIGNAAAEEKAPVPTLGLIGRGYLQQNLSVTAEFTAFKVPEGISDTFVAKFYDFDLYATGSLSRNLAVQGGYRRVSANYIVDDNTGDLKLKGLYFGGLIRF
jgi:hypothetical protein